ncbi:hypothetical protein F5878DRAFT_513132, partial [Lentinula raphanica]
MCLVTVIPGKPKQHHINHTLSALVSQLLPFWRGISYTRTAHYRTGRTVFMALLPTVCDTEAAIQISGFAAHNHTYFCRRCLLPINDIHNLEPDTWIMRDPDKHKELALEWKEAPQARREAIYRDHGVRWTELLSLPYWNPIPHTVIDDMHLGYLGLFRTHLRLIWGIDHEKNSGDGLCPDTEKQRKLSKASLRHLLNEIRANTPTLQQLLEEENKKVICSRTTSIANPDMLPPVARPAQAFHFDKDQEFEDLKSRLLDLNARPPSFTKQENGADDNTYSSQLRYGKLKRNFEEDELSKSTMMSWPHAQLEKLCKEYSIPPFDTNNLVSLKKEDMVRRLLLWAKRRDSSLKQSSPRAVIGKDLLKEVWADMARSILPSWIQPAPPKWGIPATGKLSADEYKVVCSISLVITLIRVWGYGNREEPQSRRYQMLLNFLDLVHSLHVLFLRETSPNSRAYYKATIVKYLRGVLELFPDVVLSSNHHLALHVIADLENMGPGHARSTPVFERINHLLQETKKNGHLGQVEATMLVSYGQMANLQILLDQYPELREEIKEALAVLEDIEREDHRGM